MTHEDALKFLERCNHTDRMRSDVKGKGTHESWQVCAECWNSHVYARRRARKEELARLNAEKPRCQRCGEKPWTWRLWNFLLCGRCMTATEREHYQGVANAGALAIFATSPLVDTSTWAANQKGLIK